MPNLTNIRDRVPAHQLALHERAETILGTSSYSEAEYLAAWAQSEQELELGPEEPVRASYLVEEPHPADIEGRLGEGVFLDARAKQILAEEGRAETAESYLGAIQRARVDLEELRRAVRSGEDSVASRNVTTGAFRAHGLDLSREWS